MLPVSIHTLALSTFNSTSKCQHPSPSLGTMMSQIFNSWHIHCSMPEMPALLGKSETWNLNLVTWVNGPTIQPLAMDAISLRFITSCSFFSPLTFSIHAGGRMRLLTHKPAHTVAPLKTLLVSPLPITRSPGFEDDIKSPSQSSPHWYFQTHLFPPSLDPLFQVGRICLWLCKEAESSRGSMLWHMCHSFRCEWPSFSSQAADCHIVYSTDLLSPCRSLHPSLFSGADVLYERLYFLRWLYHSFLVRQLQKPDFTHIRSLKH